MPDLRTSPGPADGAGAATAVGGAATGAGAVGVGAGRGGAAAGAAGRDAVDIGLEIEMAKYVIECGSTHCAAWQTFH